MTDDFEKFDWIQNHAPCFTIDPNHITVIKTPNEFYTSLKENISKSHKRIILSSLYLGTGCLEKELVECIELALNSNEEIYGKILLDYSRGLRGQTNSVTMVQSLINNCSRFSLFLYHSPQLRGFLKKLMPERVNETIGVQHMKIYITDNDLIISGANLSNDYFVNRQDRYILIRNCANLCDFFESVFDSLSEYSFKVTETGEPVYSNQNQQTHPFNGQFEDFSRQLSLKLNKILEEHINSNPSRVSSVRDENLAYIYPLIQINDCSIRVDELITKTIFDKAIEGSCLYLAVGYFNLTKEYIKSILENIRANFSILLSSPEANGFFGAQGFSNNVPRIYSFLEEDFLRLSSSLGQDKRISLHEFKKENWTFHAKGLWYYPKSSDLKLPCLTIIGSSNYGYRSVYRDVEAQLLIYSKNESYQKKIDLERKSLFENTLLVTPEIFNCTTRKIPTWLKIFTKTFRSYF